MNPRLLTPTPAQTEALAKSDNAFRAVTGLTVLQGWAGSPDSAEHIIAASRSRSAEASIWFLIIDQDHLAGLAGFKHPPTNESVEIAYAVAPARRNQGLATWAVAELVNRARVAQTAHVVAHTLPTENASTRVLRRTGFTHTGLVTDPDGELSNGVWHWTRPTEHTPTTSTKGQP